MKGKEILAVVLLCALGIVAIVVVEVMNPNKDNSAIIQGVLTFLGPTIMALLAVMKSADNAKKLDDMHADLKDNTAVSSAALETLKSVPVTPTTVTNIIGQPPLSEEKK